MSDSDAPIAVVPDLAAQGIDGRHLLIQRLLLCHELRVEAGWRSGVREAVGRSRACTRRGRDAPPPGRRATSRKASAARQSRTWGSEGGGRAGGRGRTVRHPRGTTWSWRSRGRRFGGWTHLRVEFSSATRRRSAGSDSIASAGAQRALIRDRTPRQRRGSLPGRARKCVHAALSVNGRKFRPRRRHFFARPERSERSARFVGHSALSKRHSMSRSSSSSGAPAPEAAAPARAPTATATAAPRAALGELTNMQTTARPEGIKHSAAVRGERACCGEGAGAVSRRRAMQGAPNEPAIA